MRAALCLWLAAAVSGCSAGHPMAVSEFQSLHPAVRWAYKPGHQVGNCILLFLPMVVPNDIAEVSIGPECVIVKEVGNYAPEMGFVWYKPSYAISMQDGRVLPERPHESREVREVALGFLPDDTPVARLGTGLRILNRTFSGTVRGGPVLLQSDEYGSVELLRYGRPLSGPTHCTEHGDDLLIVAFREMVFCIDKAKLAQQKAALPSSGMK